MVDHFSQNCPFSRGIGTRLIYDSLGPSEPTTLTAYGISIGSAVLQVSLVWQTDRQATYTRSLTIDRIYVRSTVVLRCGLIILSEKSHWIPLMKKREFLLLSAWMGFSCLMLSPVADVAIFVCTSRVRLIRAFTQPKIARSQYGSNSCNRAGSFTPQVLFSVQNVHLLLFGEQRHGYVERWPGSETVLPHY